MFIIGLDDGQVINVEEPNQIDVAPSGALIVQTPEGVTIAAFSQWDYFRPADEGDDA